MAARTGPFALTRAARAAVFSAIALAAVSCGSPAPNDPGSLTIGLVGDLGPLDPALNSDEAAFGASGEVMETLVRVRPGSSDVLPGLAQSWVVSPDGRSWTFTLRPGALFSDGSPADAAAVKANFDRWRLSSDQRHYGHDYLTYIARFGGTDAQSAIDDVIVINPAQVILHTRTPLGTLLHDLTIPAFSIGSPNAMSNDRQLYEENPTGSGPYAITDFQGGDHATLTRNPHWTGPQPPDESIVLRAIPDPATAQLVLEKDDVDAVANPPADVVTGMSARSDMHVMRWPSDATCYLSFVSDKPPFDSLEVRRSVALALDRAKIAALFDDSAIVPAASWYPAGFLGYDAGATGIAGDTGAAKAGFAKTHVAATPVSLYYPRTPTVLLPAPEAVAREIASELSNAGLGAVLVPVDASVSPTDAAGALVLGVVTAPDGDPDDLVAPLATSWHDPGFLAIVANGRATVAEATRADIYRNLDTYVKSYIGAIPLVHPSRVAGVSALETAPLDATLLPPLVSK